LFDFSIFFIRPTYSKKASSPTKQGELMAMGIPLICNSGVGDTDKIVKDYEAGIVLTDLTDQAYSAINTELPGFKKERAIAGANEFYSLNEGVKRYLKVYTSLLNS
jgi:glycosyltransferase involved in cell wall biosynthesis